MISTSVNMPTPVANNGWWQATLDAWTTTPESIKGVLIGAVITGVVTTVVTVLANRHSRNTQEKQFQFEERERVRERTLQLRREVYMPAVDALVTMFTMFVEMVTLRATDESISAATQVFATSISRIQMVASKETIKVVSALQRAVLAEMAELHVAVFPMRTRKSRIDTSEQLRAGYERSQEQILELQRLYRVNCTNDPPRWAELQRQFEAAGVEHDKHSQEWALLCADQIENQQQALADYSKRAEVLMVLLNAALVSVRKELEFEAAEGVLAEELRATAESAKTSMAKMSSVVSPQVETLRTP